MTVSVGWLSNPGDSISGITDDKSNTYTLVDLIRSTPGNYSWQTAYLDGITNKPITITATVSPAARQYMSIIVGEYTGSLGGSSIDGHAINTQQNPATTANAVTSTNFTPGTNGDLIYGTVVDVNSGGGVSAGTNYTLRLNNSSASFDTEDKTLAVAAAGATTFTTSISGAGANFLTGGMAFQAAPPIPNELILLRQALVRASYW